MRRSTRAGAVLAVSVIISFLHASDIPAQNAPPQPTRLLREPAVSTTSIVFSYANDLWIVGREGGNARRLTSFAGTESNPHFSPDGRQIAFSATYAGNSDVYVVSADGGEPRRLTWHPTYDFARGWTPDGRSVVIMSGRTSAPYEGDAARLYTLPLEGGLPTPLPMPRATNGDYSADGSHIAYQPVTVWETEFRNYRGGQNRPIHVLDLKTNSVTKLPWRDSRDMSPVWIGNTIYFLSDRDSVMNVWSYDNSTQRLTELTHYRDNDVKTLAGTAQALVYEQNARIHLIDLRNNSDHLVDIRATGDFSWAMPHWTNVGSSLMHASLSPTGQRALFEARGEVITVPADKGPWRNLTNSSGAADRAPSWSPDGKSIAWFSDASGEYKLMIGDQTGLQPARSIDIPNHKFYYTPAWSPDSKSLAFTDTDLNMWYVNVASGKVTKVDNDNYAHPVRTFEPVWSPDSKWIAYAKRMENQFHVVMLYSVADGRTHQLTDDLSDALSPAWDASGKYLYFLASTDMGLATGWLDLGSIGHIPNSGVYMTVLSADDPSPLLPQSDEESVKDTTASPGKDEKATDDAKKDGVDAKDVNVRIDFDRIANRMIALNVPLRNYSDLKAGPEGMIFYVEYPPLDGDPILHRYSIKDRKAVEFASGVDEYAISADRKKLLYGGSGENDGTWGIVDTDKSPVKVGDGKIATSSVQVRVDPAAEWQQIFREAWRFERDYFYVPNLHGANWQAVYDEYAPLLKDVRHRADLNYILDMVGGELSVGHSFVGGGDVPRNDAMKVGLLGADLAAEQGRYRIKRIYTTESWNPGVSAPLAAPGIKVNTGDYILAVNGVELRAPTEPYSLFEGTVGRQTVLRVNDRPVMEGSRLVTVVPIANESALRTLAWVEDNRRKVDELSGGKLAYVWVPNTGDEGYASFNRYYFAQQNRAGAIIDERYNHGGSIADYIVDILSRQLHGFFNNPVGARKPWTAPEAGIWGPKVMLINEMSGSGGDMLPYMFRQMNIGPLIGERTWGGLVGIWDVPDFVDGGSITAPRGGFYNLKGEWDVENVGIAPDIEVEETPASVAAGRDAQLERAVAEAMRLLKEKPGPVILPEPKPPVKARRSGGGR